MPENNLNTSAVGSALTLLVRNTYGVLSYLSIEMLLKDEDSLIDNVLLISLGIRHCIFSTNHKSHLQGLSTEGPSAPVLTLCAPPTKPKEPQVQIKLSDSGCCHSCKIKPPMTEGEN